MEHVDLGFRADGSETSFGSSDRESVSSSPHVNALLPHL